MPYVTNAYYVDGYRLHVTFDNGSEGIVDLSDTVLHDHRPIFRELSDKNKFRHFRIEADTVVWENGLDLAPDYLYYKLKEIRTNAERISF